MAASTKGLNLHTPEQYVPGQGTRARNTVIWRLTNWKPKEKVGEKSRTGRSGQWAEKITPTKAGYEQGGTLTAYLTFSHFHGL